MWPKRVVFLWKESPRLALHPATQGLTETHFTRSECGPWRGGVDQVSVRILYDNAKNPKIHVCAQIHVFQS